MYVRIISSCGHILVFALAKTSLKWQPQIGAWCPDVVFYSSFHASGLVSLLGICASATQHALPVA